MSPRPGAAARSESVKIGPDDDRYRAVVEKHFNKRFSARPDYVRLVSSTNQVIRAIEEAVNEGRRLVVTSGGHCLEGFVADPEVQVIIDVSPMKGIYYDDGRRAVAVEAGATVGEAFRGLFENWGVVVPLGEYPHRSAWVGTSSAAPSDSSAGSSASRRIISTRSKSSLLTMTEGRAA